MKVTSTKTATMKAAASGGPVAFRGRALPRGELLRSPVSGAACVHWRLRIVEQVHDRLQLVHEIVSPESFDVGWPESGDVRIRVGSEALRLQATPVLHRPGSPGAVAAARHFGFSGTLSVEEVTLPAGQDLTAEGWLEGALQPDGIGAERRDLAELGVMGIRSLVSSAPFRHVERDLELVDATVSLPVRAALGPALLPWALGTAAALLAGVGLASWAALHFNLFPSVGSDATAAPNQIGPDRPQHRQLP